MEEKVLVESKRCNVLAICVAIIAMGALVFAVAMAIMMKNSYGFWKFFEIDVSLFTWVYNVNGKLWAAASIGGSFLIAAIFYFINGFGEITVTDKRVYGRTKFAQRVDLPIDSISATGMVDWFKVVYIGTSSGKISFSLIKNYDEIHSVVNNIIMEKRNREINEEKPTGDVEEIKKYKQMLDEGIITQEEFDAKKKQIMGI